MRFRKQQRITSNRDYRQVRSSGKRVSAQAFHLQIRQQGSTESGITRIGIIASKKIGNAVIRNRAKRLFREIFRKEQSRLPEALDIVLIVYPQFCTHTESELAKQFIYACQKYQKIKV